MIRDWWEEGSRVHGEKNASHTHQSQITNHAFRSLVEKKHAAHKRGRRAIADESLPVVRRLPPSTLRTGNRSNSPLGP